MDTYALQRELGGAILQATEDISVDVKQPDYNVRVEVRMDGVYVFTQIYEGVGGLPVGTGGKTLLMLSGRHRLSSSRDGNYETWCLYRSDSFP